MADCSRTHDVRPARLRSIGTGMDSETLPNGGIIPGTTKDGLGRYVKGLAPAGSVVKVIEWETPGKPTT